MNLSHTRKRPRTRPYSTRSSKAVASAATDSESEAVRLLAARIPPELFENILFYVNVDRVSRRDMIWRDEGKPLTRKRGNPSPNDTLTDLKRCSLVCLFWANRCRRYMFSEKTLKIQSYEDAEIFRRYVVGGCQRLTSMHQLITRIEVIQTYSKLWAPQTHERQTSFLHLLYLATIQDKLKELSIGGPVPDGFNPAKLDSPHWGIPLSIAVPSSFLRNPISIINVHLPSFYYVTKYIRHFPCVKSITFREITWGGQTPYSLPHASSTNIRRRRPHSMSIVVEGVCTDSVHLALTALMINPNCPLHWLNDEERVWMIRFMTLLWGDDSEKEPHVCIRFDMSEQATTMELKPFHFIFETSASTDKSTSALSVVGMHAYIYSLPANFDALVNHLTTHPTNRAFVLLFDSFERLQESLEPFVQVLTLATETIELVLAYGKRGERRAIGVDIATLELNGCIWEDLQSLYSKHKSLEILQRQLKKKARMSVR